MAITPRLRYREAPSTTAGAAVPLPLTGEEERVGKQQPDFLPRQGEGDRNGGRPRQRAGRVLVEGAWRQRGPGPGDPVSETPEPSPAPLPYSPRANKLSALATIASVPMVTLGSGSTLKKGLWWLAAVLTSPRGVPPTAM